MVRVWHLAPQVLDGRRVTGEHVENHIIVGVLLRMYEVAAEQDVPLPDVDWTGIRIGWRTHPQVVKWIGKVGALIERHDILAQEMHRRKWVRDGAEGDWSFNVLTDHQSPMLDLRQKLLLLDPEDYSYGSFFELVNGDHNRQIIDLRHLFEKWDREIAAGKPPKGHEPTLAYAHLSLLAGGEHAADMMLNEKLLT